MRINKIVALVLGLGGLTIGGSAMAQSSGATKTKTTTTETTTSDVDGRLPDATPAPVTTPIEDPTLVTPPGSTNTNNLYITNPPAPTSTPVVVEPTPPILLYPPAPPAPVVVPPPVRERQIFGNAVEVGGGVANFTRGEAASRTDTGGYWDARL